ncbi:hypothetical protein FSARC_6693 [Fusarium sarcochroum]|uniref:NADP-dependent oxidoreductase domain-containing protein n=1 Tax=Fusarium sarcochroum TaxID=1208366 RepID=A0A8H4TWY8_9HYPO|nr:hypothetical protein FSARC_6693 [Fusarium sarcochroum]
MTLPATFPMRVANNKIVQVPSVGFGTFAAENPDWCTDAVATALKAGYRHLDTAWEYGVEAQIAQGIRQSGVPRSEIFITSKFWPQFAAPENVEKALDITLEALETDYIDLFLAHFPVAIKPAGNLFKARNFLGATPKDQKAATDKNGNYVPDPEHCSGSLAKLNGGEGSFVPTWLVMKALVQSGKCRAVGVSNFEIEHLEELRPHASHDDVPISCNQVEAHPWFPNNDLLDLMRTQGILATIYSPFAPRAFPADGPTSGEPFRPKGVLLIDEPSVKDIARRNEMDVGQVLQSWAVQRGTIPLAKSQNPTRIQSNLSVRELPQDDLRLLEALAFPGLSGKSFDANVFFPGVNAATLIDVMLSMSFRRTLPRGSGYLRTSLRFPSTRSISRLRVPDTASLPKSTQQTIQAHHGDNWTRALALNPDTLRRFVTHYEDLFTDQTTKLEAVDREIVAVVVSHTNGCGFCQTHHTHGLTNALGNDKAAKLRAKKIALDWHLVRDLNEKHKALAAFSELLASKPREVGKQQLNDLKEVGYEEEQIVEIIEVVGWFSHSNRLMIALGVEIDDKSLE